MSALRGVQVQNKALLEGLFDAADDFEIGSSRYVEHNAGLSSFEEDALASNAAKLELMQEKQRQKIEEEDREKMERVAKSNQRKEAKFQKLLQELDDGQQDVQGIEEYIKNLEDTEIRQKQKLCKDWNRQVYRPIQQQIEAKLAEQSTKDIERRRREQFDEYIQATNNNKGLFRDIIIPDEYDPLRHRKTEVKYNAKRIRDPLKRDLEKDAMEKRQIAEIQSASRRKSQETAASTRARAPMDAPRLYIQPTMWDKLDSTPHGRYSKMFAEGNNSQPKKPPRNQVSHVVMDHYSRPSDKLAKKEYFPRGKRIFARAGQSSLSTM